jgi:aspartyl-tRNA synthetase
VEKSTQRGRAKSAISGKKETSATMPKNEAAGKNGAAAPGVLHAYRTLTCGAPRKADAGKTVRLSGWVHRVRDHGGLLFIDLRDHYGLIQCVADPSDPAFKDAELARAEWVIRIDGKVVPREGDTVNPNLPTGEVEVRIGSLEVLSKADELPLPVFGEPDYPEDTRLKYRFLDLRRDTIHRNIMKRAAIVSSLRRRMNEAAFFEFQTPILTASSPEGARDFLVPSRMHPGKFYALPQAPQQFKQLIMIAGFDRYFQIAPCFRDEDARADRSPGEFYQLDIEMSFVTQEDVFQAVEPVLRGLFEEFGDGKPVTQSFPHVRYDEAIAKYGTDKPDLRNPIVMQDVSEHFRGSGFKVFAGMLERDAKARVWAIPAPGGGSRAFCDRMNSWAQQQGQPGLGYIFFRKRQSTFAKSSSEFAIKLDAILKSFGNDEERIRAGKRLRELAREKEESLENLTNEQLEAIVDRIDKHIAAGETRQAELLRSAYFGEHEASGPIAKNIGHERTEKIRQQLGLGDGDAVFFVGGDPAKFYRFAGEARTKIGTELNLVQKDRFEFCWITDFPFYEWNEDEKKIDFSHNPFSMPQGELAALEAARAKGDEALLGLKAYQYDIVCNGVELSSGAIRNHKPEIMYKAFEIAGYGPEVVDAKFGGMIRALKFGAPPHGGIAPGIDRMVMLLCGADNLRDVTMFPLNQQAEDLLMGAPSEVSAKQLRELHIRLNLPKKE